MIEKKTTTKRQIGIYTLLFLVTVTGVLFVFLITGSTFFKTAHYADGLAQTFPFLAGFQTYLKSLLSGTASEWSWSIGLGADATSFYSSKLFNPFYWLTVMVPKQYLDVSYIGMALTYLYLGGLFFLLFLRKVGIRDYRVYIGCLCYVFMPWAILPTTIMGGFFLIGSLMFPLLMLGAEKILLWENPFVFIVGVAFCALNSFRWPYTAGLLVIAYYFVRYALSYREPDVKGAFSKRLGIFIGSGALGLLLAAPALATTVFKLLKSTAVSGVEESAVFSLGSYLAFPMRMVSWGMAYGNYSYFGFLPICVVLIPVILYLVWKKKASAVMAVSLTILSLIPAFCSLLNFFSYPTGRWFCMLIFFCIWAAMDALDEVYIAAPKMKKVLIGFLILYLLYVAACIVVLRRQDYLPTTELRVCIANSVFCVLFLVILLKGTAEGYLKSHKKQLLLVAMTAVCAILSYNVYFGSYGRSELKYHLKAGEAASLMEESPQKAATEIEDDDFWRVDSTDGIGVRRAPRNRINEAIYNDTRAVYVYSSSINKGWFELGKALGVNQIYFKRTCPNSTDNRMGLDLLLGVKYYIGDSSDGTKNASAYADYGFEPYETTEDGTEILKNKYSIGIGTSYDSYMTETEFEKLNYAEREMAMLQTVVVPEEEAEKLSDLIEKKASDIETGVKELSYTLSAKKGTELDETNNTAVIKNKKARIKINIEEAKGCQLLVSFENLVLTGKKGVEYCSVTVKKDGIKKTVTDSINSAQGFPDIDDLTLNLGYFDTVSGDLNVVVKGSKGDVLSWSDIKVYAIPVAVYEKYAQMLTDNRLQDAVVENDTVSGSFQSETDSIAYFSILNDSGWSVYVDGEKAQKVKNAQLAFTGVKIPAGNHRVELRYHTPGLKFGIGLGICGILLLLVSVILYGKMCKINKINIKEK